MTEYMDYVFCKTKTNKLDLCIAPAWSNLGEGDEIVIEDGQHACVIKAVTMSSNRDNDLIEIFGYLFTGKRKRVISKCVYFNLEYKEDADDE